MKNILVIGGGLAGLTNSILLSRAGFQVSLIERKAYPFHRVCGEYISNEVLPFLNQNNLFPDNAVQGINRFMLSSTSGKSAHIKLKSGGFGISRYSFDLFLYQKGLEAGVNFIQDEVIAVEFIDAENSFLVDLAKRGQQQADFVIGAHGKRARLDKNLDRKFMSMRSPWVGVKYHISHEVPDDLIALHNFHQGYCGISRVENGISNLCYLTSRANLLRHGNIPAMEEEVLKKNPRLKEIFEEAEFIFEKPMVINEISFAPKLPVEQHILMSGDSAGLITPLCGNGMAMAIRSANLLSTILISHSKDQTRAFIEKVYTREWYKNFSMRLKAGRVLQDLFGKTNSSGSLVGLIRHFPGLATGIIQKTHGRPF